MEKIFCPHCRCHQPESHRFCFRCGESLPRAASVPEPGDRSKATRFFPGLCLQEGDPPAGFLRVSCYRKDQTFEAAEGSVTVPGRHVRFSVWESEQARCVLSIPETEARELASFILEEMSSLDSPAGV